MTEKSFNKGVIISFILSYLIILITTFYFNFSVISPYQEIANSFAKICPRGKSICDFYPYYYPPQEIKMVGTCYQDYSLWSLKDSDKFACVNKAYQSEFININFLNKFGIEFKKIDNESWYWTPSKNFETSPTKINMEMLGVMAVSFAFFILFLIFIICSNKTIITILFFYFFEYIIMVGMTFYLMNESEYYNNKDKDYFFNSTPVWHELDNVIDYAFVKNSFFFLINALISIIFIFKTQDK